MVSIEDWSNEQLIKQREELQQASRELFEKFCKESDGVLRFSAELLDRFVTIIEEEIHKRSEQN